ncbi:MAG: hypothetical protein OSB67_02835 [Alphaproteobacteria bacterium]|nr:hypothetical protein [Alphaproteobacteria bacterium]
MSLLKAQRQFVDQATMRTHLRVLTALMMLWLAVISLMTPAAQTAGLRTVNAAG